MTARIIHKTETVTDKHWPTKGCNGMWVSEAEWMKLGYTPLNTPVVGCRILTWCDDNVGDQTAIKILLMRTKIMISYDGNFKLQLISIMISSRERSNEWLSNKDPRSR